MHVAFQAVDVSLKMNLSRKTDTNTLIIFYFDKVS